MRYKSIITEEGTRIKAKENATSIANPITNNKIIIKPKATSYDKALSLARGLTAPCLAFDFSKYKINLGIDNPLNKNERIVIYE
jgi:hypothetical protein